MPRNAARKLQLIPVSAAPAQPRDDTLFRSFCGHVFFTSGSASPAYSDVMQKETKKSRFNVIDLLIAIIILVAIAFVVYIFFLSGKGINNNNKLLVEYTLEVRNERDELIDNAEKNIGKTLIDGAAKYKLGTVTDIFSESALIELDDLNEGKAVASEYPEHSNIYFVVNAEASRIKNTGRYSINGFEMSVGSLVYVRLPDYAGTAYCIQIDEITEDRS